MMLLTPGALVWGASDEVTLGKGLEVDSTTSLPVVIEELSEEAKKIGLSQERIEARVNQLLRKAGITPLGSSQVEMHEAYLLVTVNVFPGGTLRISIAFQRWVFYSAGGKVLFKIMGSTWMTGATGISGGSADLILDAIAQCVEVFCNEFLKANGK